jgi:hypothetical protein
MKNIAFKFSFIYIALFAVWLSSCGPAVSTQPIEIEISLSGDMLFEGANSLQFVATDQLEAIAESLELDIAAIENVKVSNVLIELDEASRPITESLLLQIVSDNQELVTIGTLNPLPEEKALALSLAEDTSILPYLKDAGTVWVLDLNITEDYMAEMIVIGKLKLIVEYTPNNN